MATTTASEYEKIAQAAAPEVTLPSGAVFRVASVSPLDLAMADRLPTMLMKLLVAEERAKLTADDAVFIRDLVVKHVIEPRISDDGAPGSLHPSKVTDPDFAFLSFYLLRAQGVAELTRFRGGRQPAAAGPDGGAVPPASVDTAGDRRPDDGAGAGPGGVGADRAGNSGGESA